MLFKISLKNIRRSVRDYAIYFFTLVIGVAIFYVFNSIGSQTVFLNLSKSTRDIIELLVSMLSGVSVFVAFVLGLLIAYADRFLMKRRNKEFALYLMLGMGRARISLIILSETVFIGIISLVTGILLGIGASQLMSAITANLFEADMTSFRFVVSGEAIIKTMLYFGIIYIAVMLFNSLMIGRCKLIDLMQSGKKSEKLKLKNPILCILVFLTAAAMLGYAYYKVGWKAYDLDQSTMLTMILMGAAATVLIYWSVSGMLLRIVMSMKKLYYRSLNSFTFRQISSKVNTMVMSMSIICLMLFITICTLTSAISMKNSLNSNLNELCPADVEIQSTFGIIKVAEEEDSGFLDNFSGYANFPCYSDSQLNAETFFGDHTKEYFGEDIETTNSQIDIYKVSDYNDLMELYGRKKISLNEDEFVYVCNYEEFTDFVSYTLNDIDRITVFGNELRSRYRQYTDGFIEIGSQPINTGFIVVPDSVVSDEYAVREYFIGSYKGESREEKYAVDDKILADLQAIEKKIYTYYENNEDAENKDLYSEEGGYTCYDNYNSIGHNTKRDISDSSIGLGAMAMFIGLYIGLVFLISSGSVLALKSLSDSVDSIQRYEMLRKLGADEKEISRSLFRQTGIFFSLPLILAVIHSIFGMKFALRFVLGFFGTEGIYQSVFTAAVFLMLIYGGYFLITYFCSKSIIGSKTSFQNKIKK